MNERPLLSDLSNPFPEGVAFAVDTSDNPQAPLPEEDKIISSSSAKSHAIGFARGRRAAHSCLNQLGITGQPVLKGIDGNPLWPEGICGSITHTGGIAAAACARLEVFSSVGIDIESENRELRRGIQSKICTEKEKASLSEDLDTRRIELLKVFSVKEAIYKALFPLVKVYFGFLDAELKFNDDWSEAEVELLVPGIIKKMSDRKILLKCNSQPGWIISGVSVSG